MRELAVSEIFGPTVQGEGPSVGTRAVFVRLMGCNLHCTWCDTPYTWDAKRFDLKSETHMMAVQSVAAQVQNRFDGWGGLVVITGGEPLLQGDLVQQLLWELASPERSFEIETAGTLHWQQHPFPMWVRFNVSPKLSHSGNDPRKALNIPVLKTYVERETSIFKFVCKTENDLAEVVDLCTQLQLRHQRVWIMPEGTNGSQIRHRLEQLARPALEKGFNLTTRLHVELWGSRRGV